MVQSSAMAPGAPEWLDELTLRTEAPWLPMGTRALRDAPLLQGDGAGAQELRRRKEQLLTSARHDVVVAMPGTEAVATEAADLVARAVGQGLDPALPPLEAAALLVPDDLVVLADHQGSWRMAAGVVCFPSHWSPPSKLGLPVADIHGPVPGYADELRPRVDRFLDNLTPGRPVWRRNWTVHASAELHAPHPVTVAGPVAPPHHWLRSERQALAALPLSAGILFTIGTEQVQLDVLRQKPDTASRLAAALRATPTDLARYRFGDLDIAGIASWLERHATVGRPG